MQTPLDDDVNFPDGMKILLVVKNDSQNQPLEEMCSRCNYHVTKSSEPLDDLLSHRQRWKDNTDVVIIDGDMQNKTDVTKFIQTVAFEMNVPIILISSLDTISSDLDQKRKDIKRSAKHAFENGACDYLAKPISQEILNEIWQRVYRRRLRIEE